jgi:subtilase family serine protease
MRKLLVVAATAAAVAVPLLLTGTGGAANGNASAAAVCPGAPTGSAHCHALVVTDEHGNPAATSSPTGYGPAQFHGAYSLPATASTPTTIAIVDAYDDPTIANDLAAYSAQFGLTPMDCVNGHPCFRKVDQGGGTSYPRKDAGWALEISLDVEVAHAICQNCDILLVEAASNSFANLGTAENYAAAHATIVSNSWGAGEFSSETASAYDAPFNHPGVAITFSSGDGGYGVEYPAASPWVTAVGGTTLNVDSNNNRTGETVWSGAGSGCSAYEPKPSWQTDSGCTRRTVADVAADADPATGASVYDTTRYQGQAGWFQVGGTSLASPLIASVYALAGNSSNVTYGSYPYSHTSQLFDVTSGSNGSCGGSYLCTARSGYDGPTGNGTPNGTGGF